jgi:hypothetical protein
VSARDGRPFVVTRRRVTLLDAGLPTQPYEHATRAMEPGDADALIATVRSSASGTTERALERLVGEMSCEHPIGALTIRTPPFETLPASVAMVRASYQLLCSADGLLYHLALTGAARRLGLEVQRCKRGNEIDAAAVALGVSPKAVEAFVIGRGRPPGPPWTAEHRRAYAAAIANLAPRVRGLTIA